MDRRSSDLIDVSRLGISSEEVGKQLLKDYKVWVNAGTMYGSEGFIRINLACPRTTLAEGLDRVTHGLASMAAR